MANDTLPKGPDGLVILDAPVYRALAERSSRGDTLTITGNCKTSTNATGRVVYIPFPDVSKAQWMKVKTAADSNGVAVCNTWDGTTAGTADFNVRVVCSTALGELLWVMGATPSAGVQKSGVDVTLMEYVSGPIDKVRLRKVGGALPADGNSGPSTWTYDLYDPTNTFKRASALAPAFRPLPTWTDQATWGEAIYLNGVWQLIRAYEPLHDKSNCNDSEYHGDGS